MSQANRPNRKASDADIIQLNSMGFSLGFIADKLDVHPTTVTLRLKALGIPPADTRRNFMEQIFSGMTMVQLEKLSNKLSPGYSIKDHVRKLLIQDLTAP